MKGSHLGDLPAALNAQVQVLGCCTTAVTQKDVGFELFQKPICLKLVTEIYSKRFIKYFAFRLSKCGLN